jgi:hypothetical protein
MVRSTTIFRVHDALPLAASVDDENVSAAPRWLLGRKRGLSLSVGPWPTTDG